MGNANGKILFVGTAESEHVEMYLKAICWIRERTVGIRISSIARILNVTQPSVVQMLKKLYEMNLVTYNKTGVYLTTEGERIGKVMIRNCRLLEVMILNALKIEIED